GQPVEAIVVGEEGRQLGGEFGMAGQEHLPVGALARVYRRQVLGQDLVQLPLAFRRIDWRSRHGYPPVSSPNTTLNSASPRRRRPATEAGLRPICRPTSWTGRPWTWCSSRATRWSSGSRVNASANLSSCSWRWTWPLGEVESDCNHASNRAEDSFKD